MKQPIPSRIALAMISGYRLAVSPLLHAFGGPLCGCRYYPTCSQYGAECVRRFGALRGLLLALLRIGRCAPWGRGGLDPAPQHWRDALPFRRDSLKTPKAPGPVAGCCYHHHG